MLSCVMMLIDFLYSLLCSNVEITVTCAQIAITQDARNCLMKTMVESTSYNGTQVLEPHMVHLKQKLLSLSIPVGLPNRLLLTLLIIVLFLAD